MNCPTCGLLNVPAAKFCIHCKSPIDLPSRPAAPAGGNVVELNRVKAPAASSGGAQAQRAPAPQSDWREQLNLTLERLKEKHTDASAPRTDALTEDFRQREFIRPSVPDLGSQTEAPARHGYHPLAEKALEKIDRVKASSAEGILGIRAELNTAASIPPEPEISPRRRRSARRSDKPERIEIDLNQPSLPFESNENPATPREDQVQVGLAAAALAPRIKAGLIDALFVFGCFLIFLLIVFFVPEFELFRRSSILGMSAVLLFVFLSYIGVFTALGARTLGMDHEQLEVVTYKGTPLTSREACLRCFGYLISLGCFGLGFLWAVFDPERLTWHDKISKTLVVQRAVVSSTSG